MDLPTPLPPAEPETKADPVEAARRLLAEARQAAVAACGRKIQAALDEAGCDMVWVEQRTNGQLTGGGIELRPRANQ